MIIYVAVMSWGLYEDYNTENVYVGTELDAAINAIKEFTFPMNDANAGFLQTWRDGKMSLSVRVL